MTFLELAKARYSCRSFTNEAVDEKDIETILCAANAAPTAVNRQPFHIFLAQGEKAKEVSQLAGIHYPVCRKTPCFSYGDIRHFHRIYASN